ENCLDLTFVLLRGNVCARFFTNCRRRSTGSEFFWQVAAREKINNRSLVFAPTFGRPRKLSLGTIAIPGWPRRSDTATGSSSMPGAARLSLGDAAIRSRRQEVGDTFLETLAAAIFSSFRRCVLFCANTIGIAAKRHSPQKFC